MFYALNEAGVMFKERKRIRNSFKEMKVGEAEIKRGVRQRTKMLFIGSALQLVHRRLLRKLIQFRQ